MKKLWLWGEQQHPKGPVTTEEMQDLIEKGRVGPMTLICLDGTNQWKPTCEHTEFTLANIDEPAPIPREKFAYEQRRLTLNSTTFILRRVMAKFIDLLIVTNMVLIVIALFLPKEHKPSLFSMLTFFIVFAVFTVYDTLSQYVFHTTIGKNLIGIRLKGELTFKNALKRSTLQWIFAFGLGIKELVIVLPILQWLYLIIEKTTIWDRVCKTSLESEEVSLKRCIYHLGTIVGLALLVVAVARFL